MFISGADEPLQRWEMCVETLQRFMGFALASMQDIAMDETSKNAATDVVSVMVNGIYSGNNTRYLTLWRRNFLLNFSTPCILNANNTGTKKGSIMK